MSCNDKVIGSLGFQVVRVTDNGDGNVLENFEREVEEFLDNPTIISVVDINYQQSFVGNQNLGSMRVQWIAFITVRYDKAMHETLIAEQNGQQTLEIEPKK